MNEKPFINDRLLEDVYDIRQKIGDGHFAEVNLAVCRESKKEYAAKFILKQRFNASVTIGKENKGTHLADIDREAFILTNLKHENIVKLHEVFHCRDAVVLILDLVTGGELFARVAECERLSEEEASNFVEQILLGVQHMHSLGVVHLDLKPENIMIEDLASRKIKIIDFGLARVLNPNETFQDMAGTPEFCAPEIVNFDPITFATDMWAIGVITYILLTGISPFAGDSQIETFQNILDCIVDYNREEIRDATELAKDFIRRLLVKNPRKRATVKECLQHPWIRPSDNLQQTCRRGSLIKKANLDGLRHFLAVQPNGEGYPSTPPLSPAKLPDAVETSKEHGNAFFSSESAPIKREEAQPPPRPPPPLPPLPPQTTVAATPSKVDAKQSRSLHSRKHGPHRKGKRSSMTGHVETSPPQEHSDSVAATSPADSTDSTAVDQSVASEPRSTTSGGSAETRADGSVAPASTGSEDKFASIAAGKAPGGWRASLSHSLIGRLGAAFAAATTNHHAAPATSSTVVTATNGPRRSIGGGTGVGAVNDPLTGPNSAGKPVEPRRQSSRDELSGSQDSSDGGSFQTSHVANWRAPAEADGAVRTDQQVPKKPVRRGLQTGSVTRAVLEFETSLSTDSDEPQSRDGRNGRAQSISSQGSETERKIWDVHKINKGPPANDRPKEPKRQQVGRLQQLFESGAVSQKRASVGLLAHRPDQYHPTNPKPVTVITKRD